MCKPLTATTALWQGLSLLYPADVGQSRNTRHITLGSPLGCLHSQAAGFALHQPLLTPLMIQPRNRPTVFTVGLSAAPCHSRRSPSRPLKALRGSRDTTEVNPFLSRAAFPSPVSLCPCDSRVCSLSWHPVSALFFHLLSTLACLCSDAHTWSWTLGTRFP